ncbi:MAG: GIY-YIG nuclease family protein [Niabella sp.]
MAVVYVLYSLKANKYYIGSCLNLVERISAHKNKLYPDSFTSKFDDWELFYEIGELEYKAARKIEKHLKKMKSVTYLKNLKVFPEISEKLISRYS